MQITREVLEQFGAKIDPKRGGYVIEAIQFRIVFLTDPANDAIWHARITPKPDRLGARAFVVATEADLFHALYYAGRAVGGEDIRHKFRVLMDVAEGDTIDEDTP